MYPLSWLMWREPVKSRFNPCVQNRARDVCFEYPGDPEYRTFCPDVDRDCKGAPSQGSAAGVPGPGLGAVFPQLAPVLASQSVQVIHDASGAQR